MIECDKCERWFHGSCVHVVEGSIPKKAKWFCPDCLAGSAAAGSAVLAAPRPASGLKHHTQPDAGKALPKKKKKKYRHREEKAASKDGRGEPSKMDQRAPLPKLKIKIPPPPLAPTKTPSTEEGEGQIIQLISSRSFPLNKSRHYRVRLFTGDYWFSSTCIHQAL